MLKLRPASDEVSRFCFRMKGNAADRGGDGAPGSPGGQSGFCPITETSELNGRRGKPEKAGLVNHRMMNLKLSDIKHRERQSRGLRDTVTRRYEE